MQILYFEFYFIFIFVCVGGCPAMMDLEAYHLGTGLPAPYFSFLGWAEQHTLVGMSFQGLVGREVQPRHHTVVHHVMSGT